MDSLQLMKLQVPTLFVCNSDGRLRYIREPGFEESELDSAPRFFMGRTVMGTIWHTHESLPDALVRDLDRLCGSEPVVKNVEDLKNPPKTYEAIRALLDTHNPTTIEERGPAYWLPGESTFTETEKTVLITKANVHLVEAHFPWLLTFHAAFKNGSVAASLEGGVAVALCHCSRFVPQAAEAGINTAERARGRGHATNAVALWAAAVRHSGRLALYSTSWDNLASQGVARKSNAILYGEDWSVM